MSKKIKLRNKDFVCPYCFNNITKCDCNNYIEYLIRIDRNIQEHIRILNDKGYKTRFCCEGHDTYIYIRFELNAKAIL